MTTVVKIKILYILKTTRKNRGKEKVGTNGKFKKGLTWFNKNTTKTLLWKKDKIRVYSSKKSATKYTEIKLKEIFNIIQN